MRMNDLKPAPGSKTKRKRVGRGGGSGMGKTCGRGHKGQKSRSGAGVKAGFEGGQMPLQRRLPKFGFTSLTSRFTAELRLNELLACDSEVIDLAALKAAGIIGRATRRAKVIASGALDRPLHVKGLMLTKGAKTAIEEAGGRVED